MQRLYQRITSWAARDDAERRLSVLAVVEGVKYPVMAEVMLVPMVVLRPDKGWRYAFLATVGSVVGALLAYVVGWLLWLTVGQGMVMVAGLEDVYATMVATMGYVDVIVVLAAGISPLPFKLVAVVAGMLQMNVAQFAVAALIARGARFWCVAWLVWRHGPRMKLWVEQRFEGISRVAALGLLFVLGVIKYMAS